MKRILATVSIAAFASIGFAGAAQAEPSSAACFGQVHKSLGAGVGDLVMAEGGQGKNAIARSLCD